MTESYKKFIAEKDIWYDKDKVQQTLNECKDITFIKVSFFSDKKVAEIKAETYHADAYQDKFRCEPIDSLHLICRDEKKRKPKTYEKLKLKKEDFENGTEEHNAAKMLSDYFIEHTGIIVSYKTQAIVNALNKIIQKYSFKCISNSFYDMSYMIKVCNEDYPDMSSINNTVEAFKMCLHQYKNMKHLEQNKMTCAVNYAYYWENEFQTTTKWIVCNTSLAIIYYDTLRNRWGITKKEQKKTNMRIERIDTMDVEQQLLKKYRSKDLSELEEKLKRLKKEREEKMAG